MLSRPASACRAFRQPDRSREAAATGPPRTAGGIADGRGTGLLLAQPVEIRAVPLRFTLFNLSISDLSRFLPREASKVTLIDITSLNERCWCGLCNVRLEDSKSPLMLEQPLRYPHRCSHKTLGACRLRRTLVVSSPRAHSGQVAGPPDAPQFLAPSQSVSRQESSCRCDPFRCTPSYV